MFYINADSNQYKPLVYITPSVYVLIWIAILILVVALFLFQGFRQPYPERICWPLESQILKEFLLRKTLLNPFDRQSDFDDEK